MAETSRPRRVLLTGAAGFIGARLARALLTHGCTVVALVRPTSNLDRLAGLENALRLVGSDFHDLAAADATIAALRPDVLVHAAWHAEPGAYLTHPGNVSDLAASLALFERAERWGCQRIVGIGTCLEYDSTVGYLHEDTPLRPRSLYASTKAALYLAASAWCRQRGLSFRWARLFYQFGPGEDRRRLVPAVISALLAGEPVSTTRGEQVRDYLHVDDVAGALARVTLGDVEGAVNIGSGRPRTVREIVLTIADMLGRRSLLQLGGRPEPREEPHFLCANTTTLRTQVGWQPELTLEEGLARAIDTLRSPSPTHWRSASPGEPYALNR
jgi:nucleoside-diphosphate-sugar epimerase